MTCNSGKESVVTGKCMTNLNSKQDAVTMCCNPKNAPKILDKSEAGLF